MKWKQFFTPVKSFSTEEAKDFMTQTPGDKFTILDVRQPSEYEAGHLPGAKLVPVGELKDRLKEIDPNKPAIVY